MNSLEAILQRFGRLSTGLKMLFILSLALLPLGLIMLLSSLDTAEAARQGRIDEAILVADSSAQKLSETIDATANGLRAATTATAIDEVDPDRCARTLIALAGLEEHDVGLAIFDAQGNALCATERRVPHYGTPPTDRLLKRVTLDPDSGDIRVVVRGANDNAVGVAEFPAEAVGAIVEPAEPIENFEFSLSQGDVRHVLRRWDGGNRPARAHDVTRMIVDDQLRFDAAFVIDPIRLPEMLSIGLPLLMWLLAAFLGWYLVNRILLRPLGRLQSAVAAYGADRSRFILPRTATIAREIQELGRAFEQTVDTLADNREELEAGIAEQRRLTREVHHRVKNNLQVIASLLNLHAREAKSEDAADAYAAIQRRVGALAVVQRNLFAETDSGVGVAIRPIISELASGLHQGAPIDSGLSLMLDVDDLQVSQDVAVPIAFLITEIVELALASEKDGPLAISLTRESEDRALLALTAEALRTEPDEAQFERYSRVLEGLARQLRATLERDVENGRYSISIAII